ncbi:MAG: GNAT family N-acetyltransferase [Bryobacteraceae bacterium]
MDFRIREWDGGGDEPAMLGRVLLACVHGGASVSFVLPLSDEEARGYWAGSVSPAVRAGTKRVLLAEAAGQVEGCVVLGLDTPPNQRHRAEVMKLLVHPESRRHGIARTLMAAVEEMARACGRTLLTLDTRTGDAAERLYLSMGYQLAGVIPRFARGPHTPALDGTSIFFKELSG